MYPDLLYLIAAISIVILTAALILVCIEFVKFLRCAQQNLNILNEILEEIKILKDKFKYGFIGILSVILNSFIDKSGKIGEKNE